MLYDSMECRLPLVSGGEACMAHGLSTGEKHKSQAELLLEVAEAPSPSAPGHH